MAGSLSQKSASASSNAPEQHPAFDEAERAGDLERHAVLPASTAYASLENLHGAMQASDYAAVAGKLQAALLADDVVHQSDRIQLMATGVDIAQLCAEAHAERGWHESCAKQAADRERRLQEQLLGVLAAVRRWRTAAMSIRGRRASDVSPLAPKLLEVPTEPNPAAPGAPTVEAATLAQQSVANNAASGRSGEPQPRIFPTLDVYCLGTFKVFVDDQPVVDWANGKSKSVFKFLVAHRDRPVSKEILMDTFWPNATPEAARNNLNVAIYGLRKALGGQHAGGTHVRFHDGCYSLSSELGIAVDAERFVKHCERACDLESRGEVAAAIAEYRAAQTLYQGDFLAEDRYDDWLVERRQALQNRRQALLDRLSAYSFGQRDYVACATICRETLLVDPCNEEAHRRLMHCYAQLGQPHLAIRQYHVCVDVLAREVALAPSVATVELFRQVREGRAS